MPLLEEPIEGRKYDERYVVGQPYCGAADFFSSPRTFRELYRRHRAIHYHFLRNDGLGELCVRLDFGGVGCANIYDRQRDVTVLIGVDEIVENEERIEIRRFIPAPSVRLQTLDECMGLRMDTVKTTTFDLRSESPRVRADGKHVVLAGLIASKFHQVPHKVIETRTEILHKIAEDETEPLRNHLRYVEAEERGIFGAIWIADHTAGIRLKVSLHLGFEFLEVLTGPIELEPRTLEGCHVAS